ncbi:unnamed protein product [Rotaria sp. Silwood1]|nr:unnamed protein product [Rotaria sp. Silwood1]
MFLLILVLLISIPLVSPSYHIPKLGRYHTFLRIGKRHFSEPCINPSICTENQPRNKRVNFVNARHLFEVKMEMIVDKKQEINNVLVVRVSGDNKIKE